MSLTGDAGNQVSDSILFIADRDGGDQLVGSPQYNVIFAATQPFVDAVWTLTYADRDPGPIPFTEPPPGTPPPPGAGRPADPAAVARGGPASPATGKPIPPPPGSNGTSTCSVLKAMPTRRWSTSRG